MFLPSLYVYRNICAGRGKSVSWHDIRIQFPSSSSDTKIILCFCCYSFHLNFHLFKRYKLSSPEDFYVGMKSQIISASFLCTENEKCVTKIFKVLWFCFWKSFELIFDILSLPFQWFNCWVKFKVLNITKSPETCKINPTCQVTCQKSPKNIVSVCWVENILWPEILGKNKSKTNILEKSPEFFGT